MCVRVLVRACARIDACEVPYPIIGLVRRALVRLELAFRIQLKLQQ